MAVCIKKFCRLSKDQESIKAWMQRRFLTDSNFQQCLLTKYSIKHVRKSIKSSFFPWNSNLELSNGTPIYSLIANFHYLAKNILKCGYFTNRDVRNYANENEKTPTLENYLGVGLKFIEDAYENDKVRKEINRLRQKGVMKEIEIKKPEDIINGEKR